MPELSLCTWPEAEAYLARSTLILIPIGSTEQHGPSGLIGTDAITAGAVARRAGDLAEAMVAPTLPIGVAQYHMGFAGTMTLRPTTLIALIQDCVVSLSDHGFSRFLFVNGHGGNIAPTQTAFQEIHTELRGRSGARTNTRRDVRCKLANWWQAPAVATLIREFFAGRDGMHATASEISVTQHLYPDTARSPVLDPPVAPAGGFHDADDYRRRYPDGRIGSDPSLASPERGARLMEVAATAMADLARSFAEEG